MNCSKYLHSKPGPSLSEIVQKDSSQENRPNICFVMTGAVQIQATAIQMLTSTEAICQSQCILQEKIKEFDLIQ
jgi:hypothetical protein